MPPRRAFERARRLSATRGHLRARPSASAWLSLSSISARRAQWAEHYNWRMRRGQAHSALVRVGAAGGVHARAEHAAGAAKGWQALRGTTPPSTGRSDASRARHRGGSLDRVAGAIRPIAHKNRRTRINPETCNLRRIYVFAFKCSIHFRLR